MSEDFKPMFNRFPLEVQRKIIHHLYVIIQHRGVGDEWRLAQWDNEVGEIVQLLEENGTAVLALTGVSPSK